MPVTVVVGGQYGSEGKGKVCAHLAQTDDVQFMVRCGGPNSGHVVDTGERRYPLKQVPSGFLNPNTRLLLAPGALVNPRIFLEEIQLCNLDPAQIGIDENAGIISEEDIQAESDLGLNGRLGSTGSGTGACVNRRVLREADFQRAADHPDLAPFVTNVRGEVNPALKQGARVVVEGTQGYGLSLYHAERWPYRTARDTTAHSFLGEAGIGTQGFDVVMCLRTYPIRVAGDSGPLRGEITWEEVQRRSGYPHPLAEYTTVTRRLRRVARFGWNVVEAARFANDPTCIALHGTDYLDYANRGKTSYDDLTPEAKRFIQRLQKRTGVPVSIIGTGPTQGETIDRRADAEE